MINIVTAEQPEEKPEKQFNLEFTKMAHGIVAVSANGVKICSFEQCGDKLRGHGYCNLPREHFVVDGTGFLLRRAK